MSTSTDSGIVYGYGKNAKFWFDAPSSSSDDDDEDVKGCGAAVVSSSDNDCFTAIADSMADTPLDPGVIERNNKKYIFLFEHAADSDVVNATDSCTSCRACTHASKCLSCLSDKNGRIFMTDTTGSLVGNDSKKVDWARMARLTNNVCKGRITGIKILPANSSSVCDLPRTSGESDKGVPWRHLMIGVPPECRSSPYLTVKEISTFTAAVKRYILDGQLTGPDQTGGPGSQFNAAYEQGIDSWRMAKDILASVTYGSTFVPAINLMIAMLEELGSRRVTSMSPKERILFFANHLGPISEDLYSGAVAPLWQTIKQISDLLETARDQKAFKKICDERLSPLNYMRREALSEGQLNTAMSLLPSFTVTVATVADHTNAVPVGVHSRDTSSSSTDAFAALMHSAGKKGGNKSFADRCADSGNDISTQIKGIKSFKTLIDFVTRHPNIEVLVNTSHGSLTYLANFSLPADYMSVPFGWCFINNSVPPACWKMSGWMPVEYIIPAWENLVGTKYSNVFITVKGAVIPPLTPVCTFPEFLSSKYVRVCGPAFEALQKTMKLEIPTNGPLAFGIGSNTNGTSNTLVGKIHIKINGTEIILTEMI